LGEGDEKDVGRRRRRGRRRKRRRGGLVVVSWGGVSAAVARRRKRGGVGGVGCRRESVCVLCEIRFMTQRKREEMHMHE
jgi:hypothetical protein